MKRGPVIRKEKLDVLIPAVPKDLATLPLVIDSVRSQVRHPIGNIHVVAPNDSGIKAMCKKKGAIFVDERTVLPFSANRFRYRAGGLELSGWLIQQMIKLNGDTLCKTGHFLVIDADTVLIRPHDFIRGGKTVFYCRLWSRPDYFRTLRRLLGQRTEISCMPRSPDPLSVCRPATKACTFPFADCRTRRFANMPARIVLFRSINENPEDRKEASRVDKAVSCRMERSRPPVVRIRTRQPRIRQGTPAGRRTSLRKQDNESPRRRSSCADLSLYPGYL